MNQLPRSRADHGRLEQALRSLSEGDIDGALSLTEEVLIRRPEDVDALRLSARCHQQAGNPGQALALQERAISASGRLPELLIEGAEMARQFGFFDPADQFAREAIERANDKSVAHLCLARIRIETGELEQARQLLSTAVRLAPLNPDILAWSSYAGEQLNDLEMAGQHAGQALQLVPSHPLASQVMARLALRRGDAEQCIEILTPLLSEQRLSGRNASLAWADKAQALNRLDRFDEAYAAFSESGRLMRQQVNQDPSRYLGPFSPQSLETMRRDLPPVPVSYNPPADPPPPVFLVGFPRSGTTLLDQMLASHPGVITLEEKDTLRALHDNFLPPRGNPADLADLNSEARMDLRKAYRERVAEYLDWPEDKLLVDKLPMNSALLGAIAHVFPDARYIIALRDPRDVCLSCFMQTFALNDATVNFLTLHDTVRYYRQVMDGLLNDQSALALNSHQIRYEDLLESPERQLKGLCRFLNIEWNDNLLNYQQTASRRAINTPSYAQVQKPLYRGAMGRWKRYAHLIQDELEILKPLVKAFGYQPE